MTLNQLYYFIEVSNQSSITKAAKRLNISQPSLTVAIKNLETELGISLFHRIRNHIELTNHGHHFYEKLIPLLKNLDDLNREMISLGSNNNILKIGIPPMMGTLLFPEIYRSFSQRYPDVQLEIFESGSIKIMDYLLNDTLDLSFILEETTDNKNIATTSISTLSFHHFVPKDHPLASKDSVDIHDIKKEALILFNRDFVISKIVKDHFASIKVNPNIIMETTQINTIRRFIKENLATSILIEKTLADDSDIVAIPIKNINPITICIARKTDHFLTDSADKMLRFIKSNYAKEN